MSIEIVARVSCDHCNEVLYEKIDVAVDFWDDVFIDPDMFEGWSIATRILPWPYGQLDETEYAGKTLFCPRCVKAIEELGLRFWNAPKKEPEP